MESSKKTLSVDEQVRLRFRQEKWGMRDVDPALGDLIVGDGMLADQDRHIVFSKFLIDESSPFILKVPAWNFSEGDKLYIEHSRDANNWAVLYKDESISDKYPIADPHPVQLDTSRDEMKLDGVHHFQTWIVDLDLNESRSKPLTLIFDTSPPYQAEYPTELHAIAQVTDETLRAAGNKVSVTLPGYDDWVEGDEVFIYWVTEPPKPEDLPTLTPVAQAKTTGADQAIEIPGDKVIEVGDGGVYAVYVLRDVAHNVSRLSLPRLVDVTLGVLPTVFEAPGVNLATAADGYLIDQADAYLGVEVQVPVPEHAKPSDWVVASWGDTALPAERVGSGVKEFVPIAVASEVLLDEYTDPATKVTVSYAFMRGTVELGSEETQINVDFSTIDPGGPGPDWPNPIHPGLKVVVVQGRGSSSADDNLNGDDAGQPVDVVVELADYIQAQDTLTVLWAGIEVLPAYEVKQDDVDTKTATIEIEWSVVQRGGVNDELPVHYLLQRSGVHNPQQSGVTLVNVDPSILKPDAVGFLYLSGADTINCKSIQDSRLHKDGPGVIAQVGDLSGYQQGGITVAEVRLHWWVYAGRTEDDGFEEIDTVDLELTLAIDNDHPITGFDWAIPWATNVEPGIKDPADPVFRYSRANVDYTLIMSDGTTLPSSPAQVVLAFIPPSGVCDPNGLE